MTHHEIRTALRQRAATLPPLLSTLGLATWQVRPRSHIHTRRILPQLVRADINERATPREWRPVRQHLLICTRCEKMYLDLLELAELDARGELPNPPHTAPVDLDFLEEPTDE
jgi:hypothetical protein